MITAQVHRDRDPGQQSVGEIATKLHVLDVGVIVGRGLLQHPAVNLPAGKGNVVGVVRVGGLDGVDQGVLKVYLPDVQRGAARVRVVGLHRVVVLGDEVEVSDAVVVVAGEERVKSRDAILVGELHAAQKGRVEAALAVRVHARVDARAVAVPDVGGNVGNGAARVHVHELYVNVHRHARLSLGNVLADELSGDIVRANSGFWHQCAGVVRPENSLFRCVESVIQARSLVMAEVGINLEICEISLLMVHFLCECSV